MNGIIDWIIDHKSIGMLIVVYMIMYIIIGYMEMFV